MTPPTYAELAARCEALQEQVARLEKRLAELAKPEPPKSCIEIYPKRADEV